MGSIDKVPTDALQDWGEEQAMRDAWEACLRGDHRHAQVEALSLIAEDGSEYTELHCSLCGARC